MTDGGPIYEEEYKLLLASLVEALDAALQEISEGALMAIIADRIQARDSEPPALEHDVYAPEPETGPEVSELRYGARIYTEVPEGMITAPEACKKYGLSQGTIQAWIFRGRVPVEGKLRGSAPGGGFNLLYEDKLVEFMNSTRHRGGRPRKEPQVRS